MKKIIICILTFISINVFSTDTYQIDSIKYKLSENTPYTKWEVSQGKITIDYEYNLITINSFFYQIYKYNSINHFINYFIIIDDFYSKHIILSIYDNKKSKYFLIDDTKNKIKYYFKINKIKNEKTM